MSVALYNLPVAPGAEAYGKLDFPSYFIEPPEAKVASEPSHSSDSSEPSNLNLGSAAVAVIAPGVGALATQAPSTQLMLL